MSTRTDKVNLDVVINGERAGKTLADLNAVQRALTASIRETKIGSAEYMEQMEKLQHVNDQIKQTRGEIKGVGDAMSEGKQIAMELAGALGLTFGIEKVLEFGKASIEAFMKAEETAHLLEVAVNNISGEGGEGLTKLIALADELSSKSIFSHVELENSEKMLTTIGLTSDQITELLPKIVNYASLNQIDLTTATQTAISAIEGKTRALKATGDQFTSTGTKVGDYNELLIKLNKYNGDAASAMETTTGRAKEQEKEIEELEISIGSKLAGAWLNVKQFALTTLVVIGEGIKGIVNNLTFGVFHLEDEAKKAGGIFTDMFNRFNNLMPSAIKKNIDLTKLSIKELENLHTLEADDELKRREVLNKKLDAERKKDGEKEKADYKKLMDEIAKLEDDAYLHSLNKEQREIAAVNEKYNKLYAAAGKHYKQIKELNVLEEKEIAAVIKKQNEDKEKENKKNWDAAIAEADKQSKILVDIEKKSNKDLLDDAKELAKAKNEIAKASLASLNSIADIAANTGSDVANFQKSLAVFQIAIDTAKAVSGAIAAGSDIPFPGNLVAIASGVATVLADMASASKILGSAGSAPKFAVGGPTFAQGGPVNKPFLAMAGEKGPEWIAPNWMLKNPSTANIIGALENIRQSKAPMYAAGGTTSTPPIAFAAGGPTASNNGELTAAINRLNSNLENGIVSVWEWERFQKGLARANAAKGSAFIG